MSFSQGSIGPKVRTTDSAFFSFFSDDMVHAPTKAHTGALAVFLPSCLCLELLLPAKEPHPTYLIPPTSHPSCRRSPQPHPEPSHSSQLLSHTHLRNFGPDIQFKQYPTSFCTYRRFHLKVSKGSEGPREDGRGGEPLIGSWEAIGRGVGSKGPQGKARCKESIRKSLGCPVPGSTGQERKGKASVQLAHTCPSLTPSSALSFQVLNSPKPFLKPALIWPECP